MVKAEVNLISLDIRKWILEIERLHLNVFYLIDEQEYQNSIELSLTQAPNMVAEFIGKFTRESETQAGRDVIIADEELIREKLGPYFKKILSELKPAKTKKNKARSGLPKYFDVYNENQDLSFLSPNLRFHVLLNWARRYYEKDDYSSAIDPLKKLQKIKPDHGITYKWLARSLKKVRRYDEAMRYYELYENVDKSIDSKLELAKSYRKGKLFDKSEKIYKDILKNEPENKEARIGLVQIKYARMEKDYLPILDELHEDNSHWLNQWLKEEFNFRIYNSPKTVLPALQAARYLGYEKASEITQLAFKNEVPSHFNPSKARMTFYKEELESWAEIINRYDILDRQILLKPDKIKDFLKTEPGLASNGSDNKSNTKPKKNSTKSTRVEEIIRQIREARAQRARYNSGSSMNSHIPQKGTANQISQPNSREELEKKTGSESKTEIDRKKIIESRQKTQPNSANAQKKKRASSKAKSKSKTGQHNSVPAEITGEN